VVYTCLSEEVLQANDWDSSEASGQLLPVAMADKPGHPHLMALFRCIYSNCSACKMRQCTSRKHRFHCLPAHHIFHRVLCDNAVLKAHDTHESDCDVLNDLVPDDRVPEEFMDSELEWIDDEMMWHGKSAP
jgi:hypothetical protein